MEVERKTCLVLADVGVADGAPGVLHGLLKVGASDAWDGVDFLGVLLHHVGVVGLGPLTLDILLDVLPATL
jgi:hypothetical protein